MQYAGLPYITLIVSLVIIIVALGALILRPLYKHTVRNYLELQKSLAEAKKSRDEAEAANIAKTEFMANMSHELLTPMNGIIGFTDLVLSTRLQPAQREYLNNVSKSAHSLLHVINDILDFSKIEAGRLMIEETPFSLRQIVEETVDMVSVKAFSKGLEMICHIDPLLPSQLKGDQCRIKQILVNLVGNAVKFTSKGDIVVAVTCNNKRMAGEKEIIDITINVKDTGIGIAPDKLEKIFESFTQEDASTTRKFGGAGFGLTISKGLAELMGGQINVTSKPDEGSIFTLGLTLPVIIAGPVLASVKPAILREVLVVDDNITNCKLLQGAFDYLNVPCTVCFNGYDALEVIEEMKREGKSFDLVISDLQMPGMDG